MASTLSKLLLSFFFGLLFFVSTVSAHHTGMQMRQDSAVQSDYTVTRGFERTGPGEYRSIVTRNAVITDAGSYGMGTMRVRQDRTIVSRKSDGYGGYRTTIQRQTGRNMENSLNCFPNSPDRDFGTKGNKLNQNLCIYKGEGYGSGFEMGYPYDSFEGSCRGCVSWGGSY